MKGQDKMPDMRPRTNNNNKPVDAARREKLRTALIAKLMSKYHPGIAHSKTEALVQREVDALMKLPKVSEENLHTLEAKIRKQSNDEIAFIVTNPFKRVTAYKSGARDEWAAMNEMVVKAGFEAESRKQAARQSSKNRFKQQLDEQLAEAEARRRAEKLEREAESDKVLGDVHAYMAAMDLRKAEQAKQFERIRKERENEMNQTKARQLAQREEKRMEEQREIDRVKKMQAEDYERMMKKKKDNQDKVKVWREENEHNLLEKERLRKQQMQDDLNFARKAQEDLDAKEQRRLEELRIMSDKMQAKEKQGEMLGESQAAQAAEDEARMLKVQADARAKAEAQYQEKLRREMQKKIEIRSTLDRQVQEQGRRKKEEVEARQRQSEMFKRQAAEALAEEERRAQNRRLAQEEYRMQLEDQLRQDVKLRPARELMMSEVERKINRSFKPR